MFVNEYMGVWAGGGGETGGGFRSKWLQIDQIQVEAVRKMGGVIWATPRKMKNKNCSRRGMDAL